MAVVAQLQSSYTYRPACSTIHVQHPLIGTKPGLLEVRSIEILRRFSLCDDDRYHRS
jgi:hypothetical protein